MAVAAAGVVRPSGARPKKRLPVVEAVALFERVTPVVPEMAATVVPCGMPAPVTGWPTNILAFEATVTVALALVTLPMTDWMVGAAKVSTLAAATIVTGEDSVTTPVVAL